MGADLNNIVKCQKLTDDHVQFLIYQILRGLKVSAPVIPEWWQLTVGGGGSWWMLHPHRFRWVQSGASITSLKYCRITFYYYSFTSASLELCISKVTYHYVFLWAESGRWWTVIPLICSGYEFSISSVLFTCVVPLGWQHCWVFLRRGKLEHPPAWNPQTHSWFLLQTDCSIWVVWAGAGHYFLGKRRGGGCLDCYINFVILFYSTSIQLT